MTCFNGAAMCQKSIPENMQESRSRCGSNRISARETLGLFTIVFGSWRLLTHIRALKMVSKMSGLDWKVHSSLPGLRAKGVLSWLQAFIKGTRVEDHVILTYIVSPPMRQLGYLMIPNAPIRILNDSGRPCKFWTVRFTRGAAAAFSYSNIFLLES